MVRSAARRALDRAGRDVEVINFQKTGEDEYGENYDPVRPAPVVSARVVVGGVESLRDQFGADADVDADIFVDDAVAITRDGGGDGATQIDVDGDGDGEYVVVFANDQGNGLTRLVCRRRN